MISEESKKDCFRYKEPPIMREGRPFCEFYGAGEVEEHVQLVPRKAGHSCLHRTRGFWLFSQTVADTEADVRTALS